MKRSPGSSSEELNVKASDHKTDLPTTPPEKNWKEEVGTCLLEKGTLSKETTRAMTREMIADEPKIGRLFKFLQILTASFGAFAHGGNDVRYEERFLCSARALGGTADIITFP